MQTLTVAVIGTGYVGLTTAGCLAHLGHQVIAIDIDTAKVASLNAGEIPIVESGIDRLVADGRSAGNLEFSADYNAAAGASIVMLCLPTPSRPDGGLDLSYVKSSVEQLASVLGPDCVVVTKSTVPVGTHNLIRTWVDRDDIHIASNPEFLREGTAVKDFLGPDRIVIGAVDHEIATRVSMLYERINSPIVCTDPTSAELIKNAANAFLATKVSFINEMSRLSDHLGADIDAISAGIGSDHRIGHSFLKPGPGWGGSCFPKDTLGLCHLAKSCGQELPVTAASYASNQTHLAHIVKAIEAAAGRPLANLNVAVWGATFKAGTDDTRDSPALEIVSRLNERGAHVTVYDPVAAASQIPARVAHDPYSACKDADILIVLTEWPEFNSVDLDKVHAQLRTPLIYDSRSIVDARAADVAGLELHRLGKAAIRQ